VSLVATVSAVLPAEGVPTGIVKFKNSDVIIGTSTLSTDGQAILDVNNLVVGIHNIIAEYTGDDNYTASTSQTISQVIDPVQPPEISVPDIISRGEENVSYPALTLKVRKGTAPYTWKWSPVTGSSLPRGLTFKVNKDTLSATITGKPLKADTYNLILTVLDANKMKGQKQISLTVNESLKLMPPFSGAAEIAMDYSFPMLARGGAGPYDWSISKGNLPPGLILISMGNSSATIAGIPAKAGSYTFTVLLKDSLGGSISKVFKITIYPELTITTDSPLIDGKKNKQYTQTLKASGGTGKNKRVLDPASALPPGLSLSSAGKISGRPNSPGTFIFDVQVLDGLTSCTKTYKLNVDE
jgi:large repetitive protein